EFPERPSFRRHAAAARRSAAADGAAAGARPDGSAAGAAAPPRAPRRRHPLRARARLRGHRQHHLLPSEGAAQALRAVLGRVVARHGPGAGGRHLAGARALSRPVLRHHLRHDQVHPGDPGHGAGEPGRGAGHLGLAPRRASAQPHLRRPVLHARRLHGAGAGGARRAARRPLGHRRGGGAGLPRRLELAAAPARVVGRLGPQADGAGGGNARRRRPRADGHAVLAAGAAGTVGGAARRLPALARLGATGAWRRGVGAVPRADRAFPAAGLLHAGGVSGERRLRRHRRPRERRRYAPQPRPRLLLRVRARGRAGRAGAAAALGGDDRDRRGLRGRGFLLRRALVLPAGRHGALRGPLAAAVAGDGAHRLRALRLRRAPDGRGDRGGSARRRGGGGRAGGGVHGRTGVRRRARRAPLDGGVRRAGRSRPGRRPRRGSGRHAATGQRRLRGAPARRAARAARGGGGAARRLRRMDAGAGQVGRAAQGAAGHRRPGALRGGGGGAATGRPL
ncbi:MAG: hypothetical protein AVDCRST_MAG08-4501, partial [uncultured Acetobacteraceae bacterium]